MEFLTQIFNDHLSLSVITWPEMVFRLCLACLLAMIFGLDRDKKNKPINFRAYMIVALTCCSVAILGQEIGFQLSSTDGIYTIDLGKIISGTLTGIGFLGAGAIIKLSDNRVIGTTTGASVWASGGMGIVIGFGFYSIALVFFAIMTAILIVGGLYMKKFTGREDKVTKDEQN